MIDTRRDSGASFHPDSATMPVAFEHDRANLSPCRAVGLVRFPHLLPPTRQSTRLRGRQPSRSRSRFARCASLAPRSVSRTRATCQSSSVSFCACLCFVDGLTLSATRLRAERPRAPSRPFVEHGSHSPRDGSVRKDLQASLTGELPMMSRRRLSLTSADACGRHRRGRRSRSCAEGTRTVPRRRGRPAAVLLLAEPMSR